VDDYSKSEQTALRPSAD